MEDCAACVTHPRRRWRPRDPSFLFRSCEFWVELCFIWTAETVTGLLCSGNRLMAAASTRHRSTSHPPPSGQATVSRARPLCSVFIPSLLFTLSLVGCQAAINRAFIPGIKVTFRSRFHALILWKAEWSGGGGLIEGHWLGWGLGGRRWSKLWSQCCCWWSDRGVTSVSSRWKLDMNFVQTKIGQLSRLYRWSNFGRLGLQGPECS